jgi:hypothetical protein
MDWQDGADGFDFQDRLARHDDIRPEPVADFRDTMADWNFDLPGAWRMAFLAPWHSFRRSQPLLLRDRRVLRTSSVLKNLAACRRGRGGGLPAFATRAKIVLCECFLHLHLSFVRYFLPCGQTGPVKQLSSKPCEAFFGACRRAVNGGPAPTVPGKPVPMTQS